MRLIKVGSTVPESNEDSSVNKSPADEPSRILVTSCCGGFIQEYLINSEINKLEMSTQKVYVS